MPKKRPITDRYERTDDGRVVIDASVRTIEDLYSNFERNVPYLKKDLDEEFVDFVTDSVDEIRGHDFTICISLSTPADPAVTDRVRSSIHTFYAYLRELEIASLKIMLRRSAILFSIGLVLLALAIHVAQRFAATPGVLPEVFTQGLTVAAWVSLWEAIANVFLEWRPHRKRIKLFDRILIAPVTFRHTPPAA
ncbi:MAG: hypothetical protein IH624_15825 [Phycisphaerae bacterium]|nr:hypothetical protein [Phycisphaerae bacterium]